MPRGVIPPHRLKGYRVRIPGSPAAVSSNQTVGSIISSLCCLLSDTWEGGAFREQARIPAVLFCLFEGSRGRVGMSFGIRDIVDDIDVWLMRRDCDKTMERLSKCFVSYSMLQDFPPGLFYVKASIKSISVKKYKIYLFRFCKQAS